MIQGEYEDALTAVEQALAIDAGLMDGRLLRARALIELDRTDEADPHIPKKKHVDFVKSHAPETAEAYYVRSLAAETPAEALKLLDQALDLEPGYG